MTRDELTALAARARRIIATWPEWKRRACAAALNMSPFRLTPRTPGGPMPTQVFRTCDGVTFGTETEAFEHEANLVEMWLDRGPRVDVLDFLLHIANVPRRTGEANRRLPSDYHVAKRLLVAYYVATWDGSPHDDHAPSANNALRKALEDTDIKARNSASMADAIPPRVRWDEDDRGGYS